MLIVLECALVHEHAPAISRIVPQPPQLRDDDDDAPPRCLECGYVLTGLGFPSDPGFYSRCPECSRPFHLNDPLSYTTKPPFLAWRFWLPGLALAIGGGLVGAIVLLRAGTWGWPLWFAVPFAAGSLLGYRVRSHWFILSVLALATVVGLAVGLMAMNVAGFFCGMALVGIFLGPVFCGTVLGATLRIILKASRFSQRSHLPLVAFLTLPLVCGLLERKPPPAPLESVSTSLDMHAAQTACWDAIMFYEEVAHEPPLILRIGLAHPLFTRGQSKALGDIKTCIYNKGRITKQITQVQPGQFLAFDIIEQRIGYERDVHLSGGSFAFDSIESDATRVTLTTNYEPLLHPRWVWRPFERYALHTVHEHVLEGMRLSAEHKDAPAVASAGALDANRDR